MDTPQENMQLLADSSNKKISNDNSSEEQKTELT